MNQYEDLFELNKGLVELVADTWKAKDFHPKTQAQVINLFFVAKGFKTLMAILHLCSQGYGEDAGILLRSLFEIQVNSWYIGDNEERAHRYADFDAVYVYRLLEDPAWGFISDRLEADRVREIRDGHEKAQAKHKYGKSISWSGTGMRGMAEDVGLGSGYSSIFVIMSQLAHSTAGVMRDYIKQVKDSSPVTVKLSSSDNLIRSDLLSAVTCMLNVVKQWNMQFNLGIEPRIMEIDSGIVEMKAKYV